MTCDQRDILAAVITATKMSKDATYTEWIDSFNYHREKIAWFDMEENRQIFDDMMENPLKELEKL